jgi:hypothetical protein
MKQHFSRPFLFLLFITTAVPSLRAQPSCCYFKPPIITVDFGDDKKPGDMELLPVRKYYNLRTDVCPDDGEFSFASYTQDCFYGNWISFYKDHTPGSIGGRMMLINAAYEPAPFFAIKLTGLNENTIYELGAWFVNICRRGEGCYPTPPLIKTTVWYSGTMLAQFQGGPLQPTGSADWQRYAGMFKTPAGAANVFVLMEDMANGGCGNDFAMDDIEVREYVVNPPVEKPAPVATKKPEENKPVPKLTVKPVEKKTETLIPKKNVGEINREIISKKPVADKPLIKAQKNIVPVPDILKTRDNALAKRIETTESEITVDLYDNGEIDGDTVTIYHNNELVVSHAGLSAKPITLKIKVDEQNPHHELVMVADNLGSIPPNTSLMVVTAKDKRYEVFISSSEQKNAKVVIDLIKR